MATVSNCKWPRIVTHLLISAVWLVSVASPGIAAGDAGSGNIGFLKDAPITRFKGADLEMFQSNLKGALEQTADGDIRRWENPKTGSFGEVAIISSFMHDDKRCRRTRISNRARGYAEAKTDAVFCRQADGQWKVLPPSKQPADKPAGK
jgi:hypothetical protein